MYTAVKLGQQRKEILLKKEKCVTRDHDYTVPIFSQAGNHVYRMYAKCEFRNVAYTIQHYEVTLHERVKCALKDRHGTYV